MRNKQTCNVQVTGVHRKQDRQQPAFEVKYKTTVIARTKIELSLHALFMSLLLSYRIWRQQWILSHLIHKEYTAKQIRLRLEEIENIRLIP